MQEPQGNLLYTDSNQSYNSRGKGWNCGRGNIGRWRNTQEIDKGKKDYSQITCYSCRKKGHFASDFPEKEEQDDQELNTVDTEEADVALYMHEIVFLNEEKVIPKTLVQSKQEDGMWYLDNGASNHMTGGRSYFSELNESIKGKVKFGDRSCVDINGKGSILFEAKTGEHRLLTDIYYIPDLRSNILSLGQATEQGCDVRIRDNYLTLKDPNGRLLAKVLRSLTGYTSCDLKLVDQPVCTREWKKILGDGMLGSDTLVSKL